MVNNPAIFSSKFGVFLVLATLLVTSSSCNYFETKKVDSDTFYQEDLKTISWDQVDQFPRFESCSETNTKPEQQACFVAHLSTALKVYLHEQQPQSLSSFKDTLNLYMQVSNTGKLQIDSIAIKPETLVALPFIKQWLLDGLAQVQQPQPAIKRAIPVAVSFKLPVVLATTN